MALTIKADRIGLVLHDMKMRPTHERLSRKPKCPFRLNHFRPRFGFRKPDPGPLLRTYTQLWTHKEPVPKAWGGGKEWVPPAQLCTNSRQCKTQSCNICSEGNANGLNRC
eukprot:4814310-Amphidinium_carterae.1